MHLREVHMENFKSFGRKLTVPFEPGFTAITGPNGSGKSNIGDAILFVLGPNSPRAIRAGRLSDLIFNGGEKGKAADHCAVSLVFDNADRTMPVEADTVTLTRKVRLAPNDDSPEATHSYFYVNGRASQKKEFVDLLNHARISADGYNITQQGDVQRICTMSGVERRRILDDIAGVTTFDKDLAAADARKAEVVANLERIRIVLDEIGRSLDQLDKDRGAAQTYRELQASIQRLKGLMAWRRREDLQAQIAQVNAQVEQFTKERAKLEQDLAALREQQKEAQARFAEVEQKIREQGGEEAAQLQERIAAARDHMVRLEEKINFAKQELSASKDEADPALQELRKIERELERTARTGRDCEVEQAKAEKELAARKSELERLRDLVSQSDTGAMAVSRDLARLKHEHEKAQLALHEARLESDRLAERRRAADKAAAEAQARHDEAAQDAEEAGWQLKELKADAQGHGKARKELEGQLLSSRKAQAELARDAEELEQRIRRLQRELAELRAGQEAAERAQGGFGRAVGEILALRDQRRVKGIVGTVAELAKVEERYKAALHIAAAGRLTAIVVEDDAVAAQCIEHLKKAGAGRATFLPLSKMVPGRPRGQALMKVNQEGCLGFALDLMEFNPRYQNAFFHVFGDTLVADTMATGRRLMGGVRIVTLDGELFEASGAMTGGKAKQKEDEPSFTNADRGRMDELLQQVAQAEAAQQDTLARLQAAREQADAAAGELAKQGAAAGSHGDRLQELERRQAAGKERAAVLKEEVAALTKDTAQLDKSIAKTAEAVAALEAQFGALEKERHEKGQLLLKGTRKDLREKVEAADAAVRELTEAALKAENRASVARTQAQLVEARRKELEEAVGGRAKSAEKAAEDIKLHTAAYAKAKAEVEALLKMERKATGALKGLQDAKDKAYQQLVDLKAKMDKVGDRMETHYGLVQNARAKLPALEESLGEAMVELAQFPVNVEAGAEVPPYDELRRDVRSQEAALDRLGNVNLRALEEYDAAAERQRGLQEEVARLDAQRGELERLVAEIAQRKKAALMEVFTAISANFAEVYAKISYGGHAEMELEDLEDPFAGGLILRAQPMGKRVTRLEALSGGEKSLTSMAFIFAIQRYDPSPFYYFDEVDQNLDAVNSELLAKMIKDNSRFAQFIVVSLRKITLKEASHLYGVSQSTPGQSEIIANFDLDTLKDEEPKDGEGKPLGDGFDGEAPSAPPAKPPTAKRKATKETTIGGLVSQMMTVEVKQ